MRLRLETAKRIKAINHKAKDAKKKGKEKKKPEGGEMTEDEVDYGKWSNTDPASKATTSNTTTVPRVRKNKLAEPPKATSKFRKRQIHKTWLPTHLWHAKRAHMTKPDEPLWRMAIPLSPTEKCFRPSHRASGGRGAIAWDMSYVATIGCEGSYTALLAMLRDIGLWETSKGVTTKEKRWIQGLRSLTSWASAADDSKTTIAPVTVLWESKSSPETDNLTAMITSTAVAETGESTTAPAKQKHHPEPRGRFFLRCHPSSFYQLWQELRTVAQRQRPSVNLEDLRFEIASLDIVGPSSTEALCAILQPVQSSPQKRSTSENLWKKLPGLTNPASLPVGAVMALKVTDPRLHHPRKSPAISSRTQQDLDQLNDLAVDWLPEDQPFEKLIFSQEARVAASRAMPSQKAINRRKSNAVPCEAPPPQDNDPQIPVALLASRPNPGADRAQGAWTVLLPWNCLDAVWRCLMYCPLHSGGNVRFGGLDEARQVAFEQSQPWFPGDYPGTEAGKAWERSESEKRYKKWSIRPSSRRTNYDAVRLGGENGKGEHGNGWACDWNVMFSSAVVGGGGIEEVNGGATAAESGGREPSSKLNDTSESERLAAYSQLSPQRSAAILGSQRRRTGSPSLPATPMLATIRLTLLERGSPSPCARIYRLPLDQNGRHNKKFSPAGMPPREGSTLAREKWLALAGGQLNPSKTKLDRLKKIKTNHHGNEVAHRVYPDEHNELEAINYQPPGGMVPEAAAEVERKKEEVRTKRARFQAGQMRKQMERKGEDNQIGGNESDGSDWEQNDAREALMKHLIQPCADRHCHSGCQDVHDAKTAAAAAAAAAASTPPPCPPCRDLIGFVTTGGYNLSVGRGTAIGAIWVQRVLDGWRREEDVAFSKEHTNNNNNNDHGNDADADDDIVHHEAEKGDDDDDDVKNNNNNNKNKNNVASEKKPVGGQQQQKGKREGKREEKKERGRDWERRFFLCIVRNSGESFGRLAFWEVVV